MDENFTSTITRTKLQVQPHIVVDMLEAQSALNVSILCALFPDNIHQSREDLLRLDTMYVSINSGEFCIRGVDFNNGNYIPFGLTFPRSAVCTHDQDQGGVIWGAESFGVRRGGFVPLSAQRADLICDIWDAYVQLLKKDDAFTAFLASLEVQQIEFPTMINKNS